MKDHWNSVKHSSTSQSSTMPHTLTSYAKPSMTLCGLVVLPFLSIVLSLALNVSHIPTVGKKKGGLGGKMEGEKWVWFQDRAQTPQSKCLGTKNLNVCFLVWVYYESSLYLELSFIISLITVDIQFQKMVEGQYKILKEKVSKFGNTSSTGGGNNSFISSSTPTSSISSHNNATLNASNTHTSTTTATKELPPTTIVSTNTSTDESKY